jgi:DNA gyrase/topoisomerase IV subunit A
VKDIKTTRVREGDRVMACFVGSTRATAVFFSSFGTAYTCRIADLPVTTGYGEPIQKLFKLKDGERIVAGYSLDPRVTGGLQGDEAHFPQTYGVAASTDGYGLCFSIEPFAEASTRSGRKFARLKDGAEICNVRLVSGDETAISVSTRGRALLCKIGEINYLSGAGRGVLLMKLQADDRLLGFTTVTSDAEALVVKTSMGGEQKISTGRYELTSRGGRGREVIKRGTLASVVPSDAEPPAPLEPATQG